MCIKLFLGSAEYAVHLGKERSQILRNGQYQAAAHFQRQRYAGGHICFFRNFKISPAALRGFVEPFLFETVTGNAGIP